MDPIIMQKFQAIKISKKSKKQQLLDRFYLYTFIAFAFSMFCSCPFWLPYLCTSMKGFLFISLPKMGSLLYSPKLLFLVGNLIVVALIGESKFFASAAASSLSGDVYYDEYVDRSRCLRSSSSTLERKEEKKMIKAKSEHEVMNVKMSSITCQVGVVEEMVEVKEEKCELGGKHVHELALPTEELKKRADDFIARVNKQRRLEARLLLNS